MTRDWRKWMLVGLVGVAVAATASQASSVTPVSLAQRHDGGRVVVDSFWSQALGIRKQVRVYLPASYDVAASRRFPVAFYLHGAWGSEQDWSTLGRLPATLDSLIARGLPELIVVMPDGDDSWYTTWNWLGDWPGCRRHPPRAGEAADRYCVPWPHYDDYIARDLVSYIDGHYRTHADRAHRGIAGLSMGGYGAVSLALAYPDVFAAAASHSGTLAPALGAVPPGSDTSRYATQLADLRSRYDSALWKLMEPAFGKDSAAWSARDPIQLATRAMQRKSVLPALYADCGVDDSFLAQNRFFARAARRMGISLDYTEYPGAHEWGYWRAHAVQSLRWLAARIAAP
ncbi:MAG: alpha/beta hydrolase family protein [Gemmatimonadaceae bacterium]